ncbi:microtubule-associated protein 70-1-like isoform X3 [Punica granatum]|nr:microtubule-associated protein 70-1-like isoform X3 [Punica granatum]XP_031376125.1 microtubule-associated protein 70-1-like isoform X3 [Punica granatum]
MAGPHISNGEAELPKPAGLSSSASFKSSRRKPNGVGNAVPRAGSDVDDIITLLHGSDPVRVELTRLENEVREKDRELGDAHAEARALKYSERLKEKAVEELTDELKKSDEKLKATEALLESKVLDIVLFCVILLTSRWDGNLFSILQNLEIKRINDEKKAALAAQFAAEATLRRVHAAQKDDDMPPIEAIITPLEAELKLARMEAAKLQEDNRALDRLTKSKEAALVEAERTVQIALAKASLVDDLQNKNQDLMKQIEICQEENKILDKMHRQKVAEVEKLMQTVRELEEAVLAGGATANAVRDYRRVVQEMNEEKKTLEREVARAKVSANRVATVVANDWKDASDKVMPVKEWLKERRFLQGEMQQLRDKLAVAERTAKAEAQLKEKYQLRFKVLEEKLKGSNTSVRAHSEIKGTSYGSSRRLSLGGADHARLSSNGYTSKKISIAQNGLLRSNSANTLLKNSRTSSGSFDGGSRSLDKIIPSSTETDNTPENIGNPPQTTEMNSSSEEIADRNPTEKAEREDCVSGVLYDMLQKEVIAMRKACNEKDHSLREKDDAIEMLAKKVDTLNKAMEIESKRMRREVAIMEKEVAALRVSKENDHRMRRLSAPRAAVHPRSISTR